ncbi:DinB family protein [Arcticibacter tournemirensis]
MNSFISSELREVYAGSPWYGPSVTDVLTSIDASVVYKHVGNTHSIAELLLHMAAWTEEVAARLRGKVASEPSRGDWSDDSAAPWPELIRIFRDAHFDLLNAVAEFPSDKWEDMVPYENAESETTTFIKTVNGLLQHHAYHLGQISILNKQLSKI